MCCLWYWAITVLWPWAYDRALEGKCAGLVQTPVKEPILPELRGSCQPSRWCTNTPLRKGHPKMVAATCRGLVQWTAHGVLWPWAYDRAVQGKCAGPVQTPVKHPILPELRGSYQPSRWCTCTPLTQGHPKMVAATCRGLVQWTAHGVLWPWAYDGAVQGKCAGLVQTPVKQPILPELRGSCQPSRWCTNTPLRKGHPKMVAATCRGLVQWTAHAVLSPWAYDRAVQGKCAGLVQTPVKQPILLVLRGSWQPSRWCTNTPLTQGHPKMVAATCRRLVQCGVLWPLAYDRAVQGKCAGLVQTPVKQPILPELRGSCQLSRWCTNTPLTRGHPKMVAATCRGLVQWTAHGVLWPWAYDRAVQSKCAGLVQTPVKQPILPELGGSCQHSRWCTNTPLTQGHPKMVAATCRGLVQWTAHGVLWPWAYDRAVQGKCAGLVQTPVKQPILPELRGSWQPSRWCTNTPLTQGHPKMVAATCRGLVQWTAHGVLWPWAYDRAVQGKCAGLVQLPVKQPILPELRGSCQPLRWCTSTPLTQGHPKMVAATCRGLVQWTAHGMLWPRAYDRAVQGKCAGLVQTPVRNSPYCRSSGAVGSPRDGARTPR